MPPVVAFVASVIGTIGTTVAAFATTIGIGKGLALMIGQAVMGFIVTASLSALGRALAPEPSMAVDQGYNLKLKFDASYPREIVVGKAATAGSLAYATVSGTDNKYLWRVVALSDCEIDSVQSINGNGKALTFTGDLHTGLRPCSSHFKDKSNNACLYIRIYKGTSSQTADSDLVTASGGEWTSNHRGRGVAYAIVRCTYDPDAFAGGEPDLVYIIKGALIHDPRDDSTAWSENAALIAGQYAKGFYTNGVRVVGLGMSDEDVPDDELCDAADVCDEDMALAAGGTEKQYAIGGVVSGMEAPRGALSDMVLAMGGLHIDRGGEIVFLPGVARTPVHAFGRALIDDDLLADEPIVYTPDRPADDLCNTVHSTYVSPDKKWQESPLPIRKDTSAISADNDQRFPKMRRYRFVTSSTRGQRLNKRFLAEQRYQGRVSFAAGMWALEYEPGDWEEWESQRWGGETKTWLIESIAFAISNGALDGEAMARVRLGAREIGDLVDDWDTGDEADSSGVIPARPEPTLTLSSLAVTALTRTLGGATMPELSISWSAVTHPAATAVELQYRRVADTVYVYSTRAEADATSISIRQGIFPRGVYEARGRVRTIDRVGAWTSWVQHSGTTTDISNNRLAFEYSASGAMEIGAGWAQRIDGPAGWDAQVYSIDGVTGPCNATGVAAFNNRALMFGLNTDPTTNASYTSLDYAFYLRANGNLEIWESNAMVLAVGAYATGDTFSISFNNFSVRYYQNGSLVRTIPATHSGALHFDSSFNSLNARLNSIGFRAGALPAILLGFAADYTNKLVVDDGSVRKAFGSTAWDSHLYSIQGYTGGCHATAVANNTSGNLMFGLNSDPTADASYTSLDYAWYLNAGTCRIWESNVQVATVGAYSAGDTFAVSYDGDAVRYILNGKLYRRTRVSITGKLHFDSSFNTVGAQIDDVTFAKGPLAVRAFLPFEFDSTDTISVGVGAITKTGGSGAWAAQVYSLAGIPGGCHATAAPAATNAAIAFGLNSDPTTDADYTGIDFGFRFTASATFFVVEAGTDKTASAAYAAGDVFTVAYDGQTVRYFHNTICVWTTASTTAAALYFDSSFFTVGGRLEKVGFGVGGAGAINLPGVGQLTVNEGGNMIRDPHFTDILGTNGYWRIDDTAGGLLAAMVLNTGTQAGNMNLPRVMSVNMAGFASGDQTQFYVNQDFWDMVEPGLWYRFRCLTRTLNGFTGMIGLRIDWYDKDKVFISPTAGIDGGDYRTVAKSGASNDVISNIKQAPATARYVRYRLRVHGSTTLSNASSCYIGAPTMQKYQYAGGWGALTSLGGYTSDDTVISAADVGSDATITITGFTLELPDANGVLKSVSYGGGTVTGRAFSTLYHIWINDPGQDGAASPTYVSSSSVQTYASDVNYYYVGAVTTPANGAAPSSGGAIDSGVTGACVAADAFVDQCQRASEITVGSLIDLMNYDGKGHGVGLVDGAERSPQPCVRLTTASGVQLTCSVSTPITQPPMRDSDGVMHEHTVLAANAFDALVSVNDANGFRWEQIVGHEFVGVRDVMHIHVGGGTYAAGDRAGRYMFTHNVIKR